MLTFTNNQGFGVCLSTDDPKPTAGVQNGDMLLEMDTGKIYLFDEENSQWLEWTNGGSEENGGGS